jgi:drug/metabolite transporter (DMT)-like permease
MSQDVIDLAFISTSLAGVALVAGGWRHMRYLALGVLSLLAAALIWNVGNIR